MKRTKVETIEGRVVSADHFNKSDNRGIRNYLELTVGCDGRTFEHDRRKVVLMLPRGEQSFLLDGLVDAVVSEERPVFLGELKTTFYKGLGSLFKLAILERACSGRISFNGDNFQIHYNEGYSYPNHFSDYVDVRVSRIR